MDKPINDCALFKSAFQYSPDAIILTDLDGFITDINQAFVDLYGWEKSAILGKNTSIIRSDKTDDAFIREMWGSINEDGRWQGEITNKTKDGKLVTVLLTITQIIKNGQKIGYMGIDIDLTNQLKMQERIAQSQRLATIGKMAAKIAHEIRNPLSSISLNAELLEDELTTNKLDKDEAKVLLSSIMNEVDRLANLTNEYLQFSRLPQLNNGTHDMGKLIRNLFILIDPEIKARNIDLDTRLPEKAILIDMDKDQIHRVLLNLVRNSIEALPSGGMIRIEITPKNSHLEIMLSDNGAGIPQDQFTRVFEPFFTTKNLGTGLGLPISRQIIEDHNGTLQYLTDKKSGANFLITLPLK